MTISQSILFIGPDTQPAGYGGPLVNFWITDGLTANQDSYFAGSGATAEPVIESSASLPGSLVLSVSGTGPDPLYFTSATTDFPNSFYVAGLSPSATPTDLTSTGPLVLFNAKDTAGNVDLWRTDGTVAGSYALTVPAAAGGLDPTNIYALDGGALFLGHGADGYQDLFFTDGTAAGTSEVAAFSTAAAGGNFFDPIGMVDNNLLFVGPGSNGGSGLWEISASTPLAGAYPVASIPTATGLSYAELNGTILYANAGGLFSVTGPTLQNELVSLLESRTVQAGIVVTSTAYDLTTLGNQVVFGNLDTDYAGKIVANLWVSDGTTAGTQELPISYHSATAFAPGLAPTNLTRLGSEILFEGSNGLPAAGATSSTGTASLWATDGTLAGTVEIAAGVNPANITVSGDSHAFFSGVGGLYETDGTAAGTHLVQATSQAGSPAAIVALPSPLEFSGTPAQYALAPSATGTLQTRDLTAAGRPTVDYPSAQVLAFGDGSRAVFDATGVSEEVAHVYATAYGRAPDLAGLLSNAALIASGTETLAQFTTDAANSDEFGARYGDLTATEFITQVYENADGRTPDAAGLSAYTNALAGGQSRGQVLLAIAESPEARVHSLSVAGDADVATITQLYRAIDARNPDAAGLATYTTALGNGQSVQQIAAAMLASPEYAKTFGSPSASAFVTSLYQNLLGRAPDAAGLASYTAALGGESRAALVAGFVNSDEAKLATAQLTHLGYVTTVG